MYHCDFFKDYKKIGIALFSFGKMKTNLLLHVNLRFITW